MKFRSLFRLFITVALLMVSVSSAWAAGEGRGQSDRGGSPAFDLNATILYVPSQVSNLQEAIQQVPDGGNIELAAGTYPAPDGGFTISNLHKSFTIRAAAGAAVILDGHGGTPILRFTNTNLGNGGPVLFEGLTFANGVSTRNGLAGGVTVQSALATFNNCSFVNNSGYQGSAGGGGLIVAVNSTAFFFNSTWSGNVARNYGAGMVIGDYSKVYIHASQFSNNRANLPGHSPVAGGGAIHVGNSILRVTNTRFEGNQAGYVGGAIYVIGTWKDPTNVPQADVIVANSTFVNNRAARDPSVTFGAPTEGGAFHAEDQAVARIYNSRFFDNSANNGGAVNLYRASVEIEGSHFRGNYADSSGGFKAFGGAISAISNDANDASTGNGSINRPSARLTVRSTLIQGRSGNLTLNGQLAGGIYAAGDANRVYGQNGVPASGGVAENRAVILLDSVILNDLDVQEVANVGGTGVGGAIMTDLADLTLRYSFVTNSDAIGASNSSGGGLAIINQSLANISGSVLAHNSSEKYGGALFVQGSTINVSNSTLIENTVKNNYYGAAIFTSPDSGRNLPVNGAVQNSQISNNSGLAVFDDDRSAGPINDIRYNNNQFFTGGSNTAAYRDSIVPLDPSKVGMTVAELNNLVVQRSNSTSTDKTQVANTALDRAPVVAVLGAAPPQFLVNTATGDAQDLSQAVLGYAWSGGSASLDGQGVSGNAGVTGTRSSGDHTLSVGGTTSTAHVSKAAVPAASLNLSGTTLSWNVSAGNLLDAAIDMGASITPVVSGSIQVPAAGRTYHLLAVTKEGGALAGVDAGTPLLSAPDSKTILVGLNLPDNRASIQFANSGGGTLSWNATSKTPNLIQVNTSSGQTTGLGSVEFSVNTAGLAPGTSQGSIEINAGTAGTKTVVINLVIVNNLKRSFYPLILR